MGLTFVEIFTPCWLETLAVGSLRCFGARWLSNLQHAAAGVCTEHSASGSVQSEVLRILRRGIPKAWVQKAAERFSYGGIETDRFRYRFEARVRLYQSQNVQLTTIKFRESLIGRGQGMYLSDFLYQKLTKNVV